MITANVSSTTNVQQSYPQSTVTVYQSGTTTKVTLYSNNSGTALGNPFTCSTAGYYSFYADISWVDINFSGAGVAVPFTVGAAFGFPFSGAQLQYLRIKPNTGNNNALEFANLPQYSANDFDFPAQSPSGTLSSGVPTTLTLSPVPLGVNGSDSNHYLYIPSCTGGAQSILITGGSAVSGGASGTVVFTPTNSCASGFTVGSSSSGIAEAFQYAKDHAVGFGAGTVLLTGKTYNACAPITFPIGVGTMLQGTGDNFQGSRIVRCNSYPSGNVINMLAGGSVLTQIQMNNVGITNGGSSLNNTGGSAIYVNGNFYTSPIINSVFVESGWNGITVDSGSVNANNFYYLQQNFYPYASNHGIEFLGASSQGVLRHANVGSQIAPGATKLVAGIYIASSDGLQISDSNFYGSTGMLIEGGHGSNLDDIYVSNTIFDTSTTRSLDITGINAPNVFSNIRFDGCHFVEYSGATAEVIHLRGDADNIQITDALIAGSPVTGVRIAGGNSWNGNPKAGIILANSLIFDNNQTNTGNEHGVVIESGASGITITGNRIFNYTGQGNQYYGIATDSTCTNCNIQNNTLYPNKTGALLIRGAITTSVIGGNVGVDNILGTVADTATVVLPVNPNFTITGSGTTVTAVTSDMPSGFRGNFYTPDGTISFTAGASIGTTCTTVQNALSSFFWDGTKFWIDCGPGGAGFVTTNTSQTITGAKLFTGGASSTNASGNGFAGSTSAGGGAAGVSGLAGAAGSFGVAAGGFPGAVPYYILPAAFSNLPACSSTYHGGFAAVSDSSTITWGDTITGGSTNHVLAYCDGTNWTVAGK